MKQFADVSSLFLILVIILKVIDFSQPTVIDIIIMLLFVVYAIVELFVIIKERKSS